MTRSDVTCKSILIVEDDDELRMALQELLELEGYQVSAASNGEEGLALLQARKPPGLILLDLMMPVLNGWEFLKIKAASDSIASIPVVILSAWDDHTHIPSDAVKFIKKPIHLETFLNVVGEYCRVPE
jgi:CheY-like chemotaxis protein